MSLAWPSHPNGIFCALIDASDRSVRSIVTTLLFSDKLLSTSALPWARHITAFTSFGSILWRQIGDKIGTRISWRRQVLVASKLFFVLLFSFLRVVVKFSPFLSSCRRRLLRVVVDDTNWSAPTVKLVKLIKMALEVEGGSITRKRKCLSVRTVYLQITIFVRSSQKLFEILEVLACAVTIETSLITLYTGWMEQVVYLCVCSQSISRDLITDEAFQLLLTAYNSLKNASDDDCNSYRKCR